MFLRIRQPYQAVGRYAVFHHPAAIVGPLLDLVANSRFIRTLCEYIPTVAFESDITDVVYVNYIVEASKLEPLVPVGLELQRIGCDGRYALFTFLTFRHGHFGPRFLGKVRQLFPSPVQTNWRIYVKEPRTGSLGVFFVTNAISRTSVSLGARLFSEGMPMHVLHTNDLCADQDGNVSQHLDGGNGSAPDARVTLTCVDEWPAHGPWSLCFASFEQMLACCVPQDRAFSTQPYYRRVTAQEIKLDIPLACCKSLEGKVRSHAAERFVGDATPFCFFVKSVRFRFEQEVYTPLADTSLEGIVKDAKGG